VSANDNRYCTHRLSDLQRNRTTLGEPLHRRLDRSIDPRNLTVAEVEHGRQLTKLAPRTLASNVGQDVDRIAGRGSHVSNLEPTTDTLFAATARRAQRFKADDFGATVAVAESEVADYLEDSDDEVFSLMRLSDLEADEHLDHFLDTGQQRQPPAE
jgi:hypothetical protein